MKVVGGDLPAKDGYGLSLGLIGFGWGDKNYWAISKETVSSVTPIQNQKNTNYGNVAGGLGVGAMFLGPLGALAGGLAGAAVGRNQVLFQIQFRNGETAVCLGSNDEFNKILGWSMD